MFMLSGCTIDYDLQIKGNKIIENMSGIILKEEYDIDENDTSINEFYSIVNFDQYPVLNSDDVYNKNIEYIDEGVKYNFRYTYNNNYDKSRIVNTCFENVVFNETDDYYYVDISGDFYCLYSDEIVINVTTDYAVLDSNAAKVNGNKYTWIIDNKYNDGIHFVVSKTVISNNSEDTDGSNVFRIIAFIVLIILSGVTYFLYKKKNNG